MRRKQREVAVDGRVVDVLMTALFPKRTKYIRVHLVDPHTGEKLVKHFEVAFVSSVHPAMPWQRAYVDPIE
jgi:hypothetical protein